MSGSSQHDAAQDWTTGHRASRFQTCGNCQAVWYFARTFCPECGSGTPGDHMASGSGVVYAVSLVMRAPSRELSRHAPYALLLVDAAEGFRLMAHGESDLKIGDAVHAEFREFGGALIPYFIKT